ncbi:MAG: lipoate--protein ligase family protein [Candidatus Rokubacteria bacterium]|nr:lipoate--protein ligase family protein [Candidatus Rokubacteria bacterium]
MTAWRLLVTEATDGATNMAIDEALLAGRQAGTSPATTRFYAWDPPTVSLGYGQPLDRHVDVVACRALGIGLVRRLTGGSAIYHDGPERELTYSVVASAADVGTPDLLETYRWIGRALLRGLTEIGAPAEMIPVTDGAGPTPAFCFARTGRYEIEVAGRKLVGSAQRRQGGCFLQHGAVVLGVDEPRLRALFPTTADPLSTMTSLEASLGRRPSFDECAAALRSGFETEHGLDLQPGGLDEEEMRAVERLVTERYGTVAWLQSEDRPRGLRSPRPRPAGVGDGRRT